MHGRNICRSVLDCGYGWIGGQCLAISDSYEDSVYIQHSVMRHIVHISHYKYDTMSNMILCTKKDVLCTYCMFLLVLHEIKYGLNDSIILLVYIFIHVPFWQVLMIMMLTVVIDPWMVQ